MKTLKKLLTITFLIITIIQFGICYSAPLFTSDATSVLLADGATGMVIYEKNSNKTVYPASTTKIMTAIIALENCDLLGKMIASKEAVYNIGVDGVNVGILPGEELILQDLLYALLVKSANDAANIIAENIAGTIDNFPELMNSKAKLLGAVNTNFKNPHGYHDPEHYTTASDMAKITKYAMQIPKFREIVSATYYKMPPTNLSNKPKEIYSTNKLFYQHTTGPTVFYPYATGVKTGFTNQAGYNFIGTAFKDNIELISVVMGYAGNGQTNGVFQITKDLLDYGFSNYSIQQIVAVNSLFSTIAVKHSKADVQLNIVTADSVNALMPNNKSDWNLVIKPNINPNLSAPIKNGDAVGYVEYLKNDVVVGKVDLIANNDIKWSLKSYILSLINNSPNPFLMKFAIIILIFLSIHYTLIRPIIRRICKYYKTRMR